MPPCLTDVVVYFVSWTALLSTFHPPQDVLHIHILASCNLLTQVRCSNLIYVAIWEKWNVDIFHRSSGNCRLNQTESCNILKSGYLQQWWRRKLKLFRVSGAFNKVPKKWLLSCSLIQYGDVFTSWNRKSEWCCVKLRDATASTPHCHKIFQHWRVLCW